ncbi:MAG TPA: hypothetical protein VGL58_06570 [Caulobacteraceae bacterium]|jgi:hypothetical protein
MKARLFKVENRLAAVVIRPGGRSIAETIQRADKRVQKLHGELREGLPAMVAQLAALADGRNDNPKLTLDRLYEAANHLFAIAAAVGLESLAGAAYGLCDIVDAFRDTGAANWQAIAVYLDGIKLMSVQETTEADQAVLRGLRKLGAHYAGRARPT